MRLVGITYEGEGEAPRSRVHDAVSDRLEGAYIWSPAPRGYWVAFEWLGQVVPLDHPITVCSDGYTISIRRPWTDLIQWTTGGPCPSSRLDSYSHSSASSRTFGATSQRTPSARPRRTLRRLWGTSKLG